MIRMIWNNPLLLIAAILGLGIVVKNANPDCFQDWRQWVKPGTTEIRYLGE